MSHRRAGPSINVAAGATIPHITIGSIKIESLTKLVDRDNYYGWKRHMEMVIETCNGYELMPEQSMDVITKIPEALKPQWLVAQRRAMLLLKNSLSDTLAHSLKSTTVAELFLWAEEEFGKEGVSALLQLTERWDAAKLENFDSVRRLGREILDIQDGYSRIGPEHKLPSSHLTVHFVRGLGTNFEAWAQLFWTTHASSLPELTDIIRIAEAVELRNKSADPSLGESVPAMVARDRSAGRKRAATATPIDGEEAVMVKVKQCGHCKKRGHTKDGCWELHPELRKNKKTKRPRQENDSSTTLLANRTRRDSTPEV